MPFGPRLLPQGGVAFRLWAPGVPSVDIDLHHLGRRTLTLAADGWHTLDVPEAAPGTLYNFILPDGTSVPDPASRFQPQDVTGPSEVIDPDAYTWNDTAWHSRPWHEAVLYELHVGAFTPQGTFTAAIGMLPHLVELGVTAIELMPVADFPGRCNWGYDGVLLYAPDSTYGRPEDLKALVDAAHALGLMVLLDVVYNHFGPDGNYLPSYAPQIFTDKHHTPWGNAINYDDEGSRTVRDFIVGNALFWLTEYHFDGLRLDAVHEIKDDSPVHLLDELAENVHALPSPKHFHLLLENEKNEAHRLRRDRHGNPLQFTAQWNDDMHHVLHTAATLEAQGYYGDYEGDADKLGRALAEGFAFQGEQMNSINARRGEPSRTLPPLAFVAFMQNHDQIGNRAFGERISAIAGSGAVRAIAATYLLLPQVPMLFMGEEWSTDKPFPFFCGFDGELGEAVRKGRREEFSSFPAFKDEAARNKIPDPTAESTFQLAKLDWEQKDYGIHNDWLRWYKRILAVRHESVTPLLAAPGQQGGNYQVLGEGAVLVSWQLGSAKLTLAANISATPIDTYPTPTGQTLWQEGPVQLDTTMRPWSIRWSLTAA